MSATDPTCLDDLALRTAVDPAGSLLPSRAQVQGGRGVELYDESGRTKIGMDRSTVGSHAPVVAVAPEDIANLASATVATDFDGVTVEEDNRVLLPHQTTAAENGVYVVGAVSGGTAALTRVLDFNDDAEMVAGALFPVQQGTLYRGEVFRFDTTDTIVVDTTPLAFRTLSGLRYAKTATLIGGAGATVLYTHACDDDTMTRFEAMISAEDSAADTCFAHKVFVGTRQSGANVVSRIETTLNPHYLDDAAWNCPDFGINGTDVTVSMTADAVMNIDYKLWVKVWEYPI